MKMLEDKIREWEKIDVSQTKEADFDEFWEKTLAKIAEKEIIIEGGKIDYPFPKIEVRDITVEGLDGTKLQTWLILPPEAKGKEVPAIVFYHGAGGNRPEPAWATRWTSMGCAVIAHDFRLQNGLTGSETGFPWGKINSYFSLGISSPEDSYYYHSITDALIMTKLAKSTPEIDSEKICVMGGSQGGATAWSVASLDNDVALCLADVPSNSWFEKRMFDEAGGMGGLSQFLKSHPEKIDAVLKVLSYYDNMNLVDRITCPVLVSVGMKDPVCPPENVYASYNKITSEKEIFCYPFAGHEGGTEKHTINQLKFVAKHLNI